MIRPLFRFWSAGYLLVGCLATASSVQAQIVPDGTLPVNSVVTPGCTVCTIEGGTIRGVNWFHSFREFSVPTGGEAFFNNPTQIETIFSRVTENSVSNIDGLLRANGTASLFFLNPNGVLFGPNARLNIGGSFVASTASSLVFADGTVFSTTPVTPTTPLLTVSVPIGLQYGSNPGSVRVQGATLKVKSDQTLALVGGNVSLLGGQLLAPGGRVELGGLAGESTVGLVTNSPYLGLSFPDGVVRGDVSLSNGAVVYVVAGGGGSIGVNAFNLMMTQESQLLVGIAPDSGAVDAKAGNIEINATGAINLTDQSHIFNYVSQGAKGQGGDVNITTAQLRASGGSQVRTDTFGQGDGGNLTVNASQQVQLIGTAQKVIGTSDPGQYPSGLSTQTNQGASGKAGDLTINTGTLLVRDGAVVSASTFGQGDGGQLTVNASQQVQLIGTSPYSPYPSGLYAVTWGGASGKGGDLKINTGTLLVRDGAQVNAGTWGQGDGGNLTVNASQQVQLIGQGETAYGRFLSGLFAQAEPGSSGKAGDVIINTSMLLVRDGAHVGSSTSGQGDGGNLTVNASQQVQLIGTSADCQCSSGLSTQANRGASGKAGNLIINTGTLLVRDGAQVGAGTFGQGDGGNLTVNASQQVQLIGTSADGQVPSGLFASAEPGASGKAGDLTINTDTLLVRDGAGVSVRSFQGQAGNMTIQANSLFLNQGRLSAVTAKSNQQGGANITLRGLDLLQMDTESLIAANALNAANGGNITIDSTFIVATPPTGPYGSDITANADKGNGGAVNITTQGLFGIEFRPQLTPKNDITVTSEFGVNGTFQLTTPGVDPSRGLTQLTSEPSSTPPISQGCSGGQRVAEGESKFTVTGRGGLPSSPDDLFSGDRVLTDLGTPATPTASRTRDANTTPPTRSPALLVEAQSWFIDSKGVVHLVAESSNATPQNHWQPPVQCSGS